MSINVPHETIGGYKMEKVRVNMYLPVDLKEWFWREAEKNGFNLTTMIQVAMLDYKKQQEAMLMTDHIMELNSKLSAVPIDVPINSDSGILAGIMQGFREAKVD